MNRDDFAAIKISASRKDGKEPLDDGNRPRPSEDRRMMLSPKYWPLWPILPMKNWNRPAGQPPRLGVLYDRDGDEGEKDQHSFGFLEKVMIEVSDEDLHNSPEADIDQLLADGWHVD